MISLPYIIITFNWIIDVCITELALLVCALIELQTDRAAMLIFKISVIAERTKSIETKEFKRFRSVSLPLFSHILIYMKLNR